MNENFKTKKNVSAKSVLDWAIKHGLKDGPEIEDLEKCWQDLILILKSKRRKK